VRDMAKPEYSIQAEVNGESRAIVRRHIDSPSLDRDILNLDDLGIRVTGVNFDDPAGVELVLKIRKN